jgi:hypothetical protein
MKLTFPVAALSALALVFAPAAMAKTFSGNVKGDGIKSKYSISNDGKEVCVDYRGSKTSNEPERLKFKAEGDSFKDNSPTSSDCKKDKGFAKALKKANKVKVSGSGAYGERVKGTLK